MKALVIRDGAFGDVLCVTPVVHRLRQVLGREAVIDVSTHHPHIFEDSEDVDLAAYGLIRSKYDVVYDLNGSYEKRLRRVNGIDCYMEDVFGDYGTPEQKRLVMPPTPVPDLGIQQWNRVIAIHPAVSWQNRTLPLAFWQDVADTIMAAGWAVVTLGTKRDHTLERVIDTRGKYTPRQQCALIGAARAYIGSDCGLLWMVGATETPAVGLFTITLPKMNIIYRHGEANWKFVSRLAGVPCAGCSARIDHPVTHHDCERETDRFACTGSFNYKEIAGIALRMAG